MADTTSSLTFVSQQITIYVGFFICITGFIGHLLVLVVFLSLKTFRRSSCAFYLTIMSLVNIIHLSTGLLTYIMINGFAINWTNMSLIYCKFRSFNVPFCGYISFTCMCLATIDQFLATCAHPQWRRLSNIKVAHFMVVILVITSAIHGIPFLIYNNHLLSPITKKLTCAITNDIFQKYVSFIYLPILRISIPIIIMIIFGILAYRNIQQIAYRTVPLVRRELDKQLTIMVLVHVFYNVLTGVPVIIQTIFSLIFGTPSDALTLIQLNFVTSLASIWYNFTFAGSFYIYVCVSKRFRQQLMYVLCKLKLDQRDHLRININQIEPHT